MKQRIAMDQPIDSVDEPPPTLDPSVVLRPDNWEQININAMFREPQEVGRFRKRITGGHYALASEPLVVTHPDAVEVHRYSIYKAVEKWVVENPFAPFD